MSNYDKFPKIAVPHGAGACVAGWEACAARLRQAMAKRGARSTTIVVECYPGVDEEQVVRELEARLAPALTLRARDAMLAADEIDKMVAPFLGGDDPVFGFLCGLTLPQFFDPERIGILRARLAAVQQGIILIAGCGARMIALGDILVYADLPRWEGQNRFRRQEASNLGVANKGQAATLQYKRAYFVDWRVADRWKRPLMDEWDFVLDTTLRGTPKLAEGGPVRRGLSHAVTRPFRVVPFFDPAPWGGQWMRQVCDLNAAAPNYGWCFDCVPEENSLLLEFGEVVLELPALDLVFFRPRPLLGQAVEARFGGEFPIRFDFLDTMGGGNLSFQVHPLTEYIRSHFGMRYTQDESYYFLDAGPDASVYLGLREGVNREAMIRDLTLAQCGEIPFPAERYVNKFPAKKHDHFLIPAGTVHCSGANSMVLEISATPYIFTFKMWDWGRPGLDGKPRPIHLQHGIANIQWDRTTDWVKQHLVNHITRLGAGDGWSEECTGLQEREFIETRRHWFSKPVSHHTRGGVNVLNLVQGGEAVVESPEGIFEPFPVHYAETFILPAAVGSYTIRPISSSLRGRLGTIKAFVRPAAVRSHRFGKLCAVAALGLGLMLNACAAEEKVPVPAWPKADPTAIAHWQSLRFGMFIHWGPVSLTGREIGWSRGAQTPIEVYDNLYKQFNPTNFNADQWVSIAKAAGMKYIVLTTKHHDGFCLWDTKLTDYNVMHTPFRRDVVKELAAACKKQGIAFGAYYSVTDWYDPNWPVTSPAGEVKREKSNLDAYEKYLQGQITELIQNYGPLLTIWNDVPAMYGRRGADTIKLVRKLQPDILINDRTGDGGDYATPEQTIGGFNLSRPWESCMTISAHNAWAWGGAQDGVKSTAACLDMLIRGAGGDGNILLNVGPRPDGLIDPEQAHRLKDIGDWLAKNGDSIYGTRGGPWKPARGIVSTRKGNAVFLHVLRSNDRRIELPALPAEIKSAALLGGGAVQASQKDGKLIVTIPPTWPLDPVDNIVKLELDRPALDLPVLSPVSAVQASASNVFKNQTAEYGPQQAFDDDPDSQRRIN